MAAETFLARLDRVPLNRFHWRLLAVAGFGWMFDAMDVILIAFLLARVVAGLGLGGELPVAATLVTEYAPRASRGRFIVLLESFWAYGTILAGIVALVVLPQFGWRGAFVVGALPALYVAYLRHALPESPRFLAEHGRAAEADAVVRRVEREGGGALITVTKPVAPERTVGGNASIGALF